MRLEEEKKKKKHGRGSMFHGSEAVTQFSPGIFQFLQPPIHYIKGVGDSSNISLIYYFLTRFFIEGNIKF